MLGSTLIAVSCFSFIAASVNAAVPVKVRVDLIEALSPKDTTSSLRFQSEFENSIQIAKSGLTEKLNKCGYSLESVITYFDATDPLQAKEKAEEAEKNKSWIIIGPRRSNHYILLAKGAASIPSVSLMATASEVKELGPRHLSLAPDNATMARAAAKLAKQKAGKKAQFVSIVSEDCLSCVDFAEHFTNEAKNLGLTQSGAFTIKGETPILPSIVEQIKILKPEIVLVPNFSKIAAQVISAVSAVAPKTLFIGSDGWGDSSFGFLQNDPAIETAKGFTTRGFPPVKEALITFPLGQKLLATNAETPQSGPGVGVLKSLDGITTILCSQKPKDRDAFAKAFEKRAPMLLSAPFGVSIYRLDRSNIIFDKKVSTK